MAMKSPKQLHTTKEKCEIKILWQVRSLAAGGSQNIETPQGCLKGWSH